MSENNMKICMGCMNPTDNEEVCPYCGEKRDEPQKTPFLPKGEVLAERYIVGKGLEINGEGLGYIGFDKNKKTKIYIREFFPGEMCERKENSCILKAVTGYSELFEREREKFLKYFRAVARLRNINLLESVYDIFDENNTAYVVLEWVDGIPLDVYVDKKGGYLEWKEARVLFMPLLSALSRMHLSKVKHLGICPNNLIVLPSGKIKLVGFASEDLRKKGTDLKSQLYEGCSALEQYIEAYETDESTDIYGFTASLFFALTGEYPLSALEGEKHDELLMSQDIVKNIPNNVVSAIAGGLRVYPNNRTLLFDRLRAELSDSPVVHIDASENMKKVPPKFSANNQSKNNNNNFMWGVWSCVIAFAVLGLCALVYWFGFKKDKVVSSDETSSSSTSTVETNEEESVKTEKISVPNLVGKNFKKLQEEVSSGSTQYNIVMLPNEEFNDNVGEGCIISQNPSYGEEMTSGGTIAVTVSKGSKERTLPNIQGQTVSEASLALSELSFVPVEIRENSTTVAEGLVIGYKDHKPGDVMEYGSQISILVSKGVN